MVYKTLLLPYEYYPTSLSILVRKPSNSIITATDYRTAVSDRTISGSDHRISIGDYRIY